MGIGSSRHHLDSILPLVVTTYHRFLPSYKHTSIDSQTRPVLQHGRSLRVIPRQVHPCTIVTQYRCIVPTSVSELRLAIVMIDILQTLHKHWRLKIFLLSKQAAWNCNGLYVLYFEQTYAAPFRFITVANINSLIPPRPRSSNH